MTDNVYLPKQYDDDDLSKYIVTSSENRVSRSALLCGTQNIHLKGKSTICHKSVVRGDFAKIVVGSYFYLGSNSVLRPAHQVVEESVGIGLAFYPLHIGEYVSIGNHCVIEASRIGSYVDIRHNVVIGKRVVIRDCVTILENTVIPDDTVVAPYSIMSGAPAFLLCEAPESTKQNCIAKSTLARRQNKSMSSSIV